MKSNNNAVVPEAREALDKFKMEAASEVGVNLKQGYNGNLTSREAGSVRDCQGIYVGGMMRAELSVGRDDTDRYFVWSF